MKFNKQAAIIGFCFMVVLVCTVVFLAIKRDDKKQESIAGLVNSTEPVTPESIAGLVNSTEPVAPENPVELSSSSGIYKPIDLAAFSWSEQEQKAAFDEVASVYQTIIKDTKINHWDSNFYESLHIYRPPDISFTRGEVPIIEQLRESPYKALYIDNDIYVRIKADNSIEESMDKGESWQLYLPASVTTEDYIHWLEEHDPLPSSIVRRAQLALLKNGATVYRGTFDKQKDMFFILGTDSAQIQLLSQDVYFEQERWSFVLIDAEQFLLGLNRAGSIVPMPLLQEFYDEMVSCKILTEIQAQQELNEKILYLTHAGFMRPNEKE